MGQFEKAIPQGLKPRCLCTFYGTTEVVPFQNNPFYGTAEFVPFQNNAFCGTTESAPIHDAG